MADLRDRDEDGLFSDNYEIPKRENPYKKKKITEREEDSAAAYVRTEDKPVDTKRENPYKRKSQSFRREAGKDSTSNTEDAKAPPLNEARLSHDRDGVHLQSVQKPLKDRWNDFIFNHVKLICFIGGVIVLLLFISAPAIYYGIQDAREQAEQEAKDPLTINYVKGISDKASPITWSDLVSFPYDETIASDSVTWMIRVENTDFEVWISGVSTQKLPTYVYLYDMDTGDKVDLTQGLTELEKFLAVRE